MSKLDSFENLYVRAKGSKSWKAVPPSDDENSVNFAIHDVWEQDIAEVSIDGVDYIIRDLLGLPPEVNAGSLDILDE